MIALFSLWVCEIATFYLSREEKDQKSIVLDEFAGIWIACCPAATILMVQEVIVYSLKEFILFFHPGPIVSPIKLFILKFASEHIL